MPRDYLSDRVATGIARRAVAAATAKVSVARQPEPIKGAAIDGFLTGVEVASNVVAAAVDLGVDPVDDVDRPVAGIAPLSSRIQGVVVRRVGVPSHVRHLTSGGADFELDEAQRYSSALYVPENGTIRLRQATVRECTAALTQPAPLDAVEYRERLTVLREIVDILVHEHLHGVADTHEPFGAWAEMGAGFVFCEGLIELVAAILVTDVVAAGGLDVVLPGVERLTPSPALAPHFIAVAAVVTGLARLAGTDPVETALDLIAHGGRISALAGLTAAALDRCGVPLQRQADTGDAVMAVLAEEFDAMLERLNRGVLVSVDAAEQTGAAIVSAAVRSIEANHGTARDIGDLSVDTFLGAGSRRLLAVADEPHVAVVLADGAAVIVPDAERASLSDAALVNRIHAHFERAPALRPGAAMLWADLLATPPGRELA